MTKTSALPPKKPSPLRKWLIIIGGAIALCMSTVIVWLIYDGLTFQPSGEIAYECHRYGTGYIDICVIDADGSNQRVLVQLDQIISSPVWSPDGDRLAFIGNQSLYIVSFDGSNLIKLIDGQVKDRALSWSPNGNQLLVWAKFSDLEGLYIVNDSPDNLSPVYLSPKTSGRELRAVWHSNGNEIFTSLEKISSTTGKYEIVRMSLQGIIVERMGFLCPNMALNPKGDVIACAGDGELLLRNIGDGYSESITNWALLLSGVRFPSWSPDGEYIVYFQTHWPTFLDDRNGELWIMRADGSHPVKLTNGPGDRNPAWRPEP